MVSPSDLDLSSRKGGSFLPIKTEALLLKSRGVLYSLYFQLSSPRGPSTLTCLLCTSSAFLGICCLFCTFVRSAILCKKACVSQSDPAVVPGPPLAAWDSGPHFASLRPFLRPLCRCIMTSDESGLFCVHLLS